jgi:hypothetical protein
MQVISKSLISLLFLMPAIANAQIPSGSDPRKEMRVKQTADFTLQGDGSSAEWGAADWVSIPGRHGARAAYQTRVKLLYSGLGIYGLFLCEDHKITSTMKEDFADLYNEDVVEIFFWPDESVPVYFEYELSPHNYELPIVVPNLKGNFFGWRPWHYERDRLTRHATRITNDEKSITGWTAEFFIPYALLKPLIAAPPQKGTRWRANLYRIDYDEGESEWSWQLTKKTFHDVEKFGTILFE